MKSLVSELMQYSVTPGELEEWSDREDLLGLKLKDVSRVYEGFTRYLAEKYLTAEELPALLCGVIGKSRLVRTAQWCWTGLRDLPRPSARF